MRLLTLTMVSALALTSAGAVQAADAGNDVTLTAIPEPGSAVSLLGGLGCLVGLQRFRRRRS